MAVFIVPPTNSGSFPVEPAGVVVAAGYGREPLVLRRRGFPVMICSPADGGAVLAHSVGVVVASADGHKSLTRWRGGFPVIIIPPADGHSISAQGTRVARSAADGGESSSLRGICLSFVVSPQQTMDPFWRMPQVWLHPLLKDANFSPIVGVARPYPLSPQHQAVSFRVMPRREHRRY